MTRKTYTVRALWDPEAEVWVATSEDVPGLAAEAPDLGTMESKLRVIVPEFLELNGAMLPPDRRIPLHLVSERHTDLEVVVTADPWLASQGNLRQTYGGPAATRYAPERETMKSGSAR